MPKLGDLLPTRERCGVRPDAMCKRRTCSAGDARAAATRPESCADAAVTHICMRQAVARMREELGG
jgi:hypothetical protein